MALTKAKMMELIDNGDIDVGGGGLNTNLLHNWDFRNPVNQRGVSGVISTAGYFYDRWMRYAGTITIAATYLSMPADSSIEQRIDVHGLSGKAVTVSVMLGGVVISGQGTFPTSAGTESVTLTGFGTATLGYHADYMFVWIAATDSTRNLQAVKLELGTVSTLAYDPPSDYTKELLLCRRYFYAMCEPTMPYYRFFNVTLVTTTLAGASVLFPTKMRIVPTFSYGGSPGDFELGDGTSITAIIQTSDGAGVNSSYLYFTTPTKTVGTSQYLRAKNNTRATLLFSADL